MPPATNAPLADPIREGERIMTICNACRYCEGYCAVFPAMERRLTFSESDLHYLANLCHNCAECYDACQYAPPHEFAVDVPQTFAAIRRQSYRRAPVLPITLACLIGFVSLTRGRPLSHGTSVAIFGIVALAASLLIALGLTRNWLRSAKGAIAPALRDALTVHYINPADHKSRGLFHHCVFYGFAFCFAATSVAAFYHYVVSYRAPYPLLSAPVILGTLGGLGLLIGTAGLYTQRRATSDTGFIALLFWTTLTGFAVLAFRDTFASGWLLAIHLAIVMALFLTMPYGKFVHGLYRFAALVRYHAESRAAPGATSESSSST